MENQKFHIPCLSLEDLNWQAVSGNSRGKVLLVWKDGILVEGLLDPARPVFLKKSTEGIVEIDIGSQIQKQIMLNKNLTLVKSKENCLAAVSAHLSEAELKSSLFTSFLTFMHPLIFNSFENWKQEVTQRFNLRTIVSEICSFYGLREGRIYSFANQRDPENKDEVFAIQSMLAQDGYFWQRNQVAISALNGRDVAVFIDHDQILELKMIKIIQHILSISAPVLEDTPSRPTHSWSIDHLLSSNRIIMLEGEKSDIIPLKVYCKKKMANDSMLELDLNKIVSLKNASFDYEEVLKYKYFWIDNISKMRAHDADELCRIFRKYNGHIILSDTSPLHLINLSLFPAELRWQLEEVPQIHARSYLIKDKSEDCAS